MTDDFVIVATSPPTAADGAAAAAAEDGANRRRSVRLLGACFVFPEMPSGRAPLRFEKPLPGYVLRLSDGLKDFAKLKRFKQQGAKGCHGMPPSFNEVRGMPLRTAVSVRLRALVCVCASCNTRSTPRQVPRQKAKLGKSYMLGVHIDERNAPGEGPVAYTHMPSQDCQEMYQEVAGAAEMVAKIEGLYLPGVATERSRAHAHAISRHGDKALFNLTSGADEDGARSGPPVPSPSVSVTFGYGFGMHLDATTPGEGIAWPGGQHTGRIRAADGGSGASSPPSFDAAPLVFAFLEAGVLFNVSANLKEGAYAYVPPGIYHATLRRQADKTREADHSVMGMALVNKCAHMCAPAAARREGNGAGGSLEEEEPSGC